MKSQAVCLGLKLNVGEAALSVTCARMLVDFVDKEATRKRERF